MTDTEKRIAIAKLCNIEIVSDGITHHLTPCGKNNAYLTECPDYLNDLNAMHKAEKMLTEEQRGEFLNHLCVIVRQDHKAEAGPMTAIITAFFASAAQRAEALIKTLNQ